MLAAICPLQLYHQCFGGRPCGGRRARSEASAFTLRMPSSTRSSSLQYRNNTNKDKPLLIITNRTRTVSAWRLLVCRPGRWLPAQPVYCLQPRVMLDQQTQPTVTGSRCIAQSAAQSVTAPCPLGPGRLSPSACFFVLDRCTMSSATRQPPWWQHVDPPDQLICHAWADIQLRTKVEVCQELHTSRQCTSADNARQQTMHVSRRCTPADNASRQLKRPFHKHHSPPALQQLYDRIDDGPTPNPVEQMIASSTCRGPNCWPVQATLPKQLTKDCYCYCYMDQVGT
jgi:hypothetical protein